MTALSKQDVVASLHDLRTRKALLDMIEVATIAAAGSDNTDAAYLTASLNAVTASDGTKGVILPRGKRDTSVEVVNTVSNQALKVYPDAGGQINALTATTGAFTQAAGSRAVYVCDRDLHWYVAAANLTGTATAATQAELDVLAGVTVGVGAVSKAVVLDSSGNFIMPNDGVFGFSRASVAAAGTGASDATVLADQVNAVTLADGTVGVALPAAATTEGPILVINTVLTSGGNLKVYPVNGGNDNINGGAEDAEFVMGPGAAAWFIPTSATQWYVSDKAGVLTTKDEENILDGVTAAAAELNLVDGSVVANSVASKAAMVDSNKRMQTNAANGTMEAGVTAVHYGDGVNVTSVLTVTNVVLVVGSSENLGVGALLFTLPTGACMIRDAYMSIALTGVTTTTDTPEVGLGTVIATGAITQLSGTATFEDIITGQVATDTNGTATVKGAGPTAGAPLEIVTAGAHTVHLNMADGWGANADQSGLLNGTVVISYIRQAA